MGMAATLVKKALGAHSFQPDDGSANKAIKARSAPEHVQLQARYIYHLNICLSAFLIASDKSFL